MKTLLEYILTHITDYPDDVKVSESEDSEGNVTLTAVVNPADMGRCIGKGGAIINAIRSVIKIKAIRAGKRVQINLKEPESPATESNSDSPPAPLS